jgi:hypothetical protein
MFTRGRSVRSLQLEEEADDEERLVVGYAGCPCATERLPGRQVQESDIAHPKRLLGP